MYVIHDHKKNLKTIYIHETIPTRSLYKRPVEGLHYMGFI